MAAYLFTSLTIATLTYWVGGWEWCLIASAAFLALSALLQEPLELATTSVLSLFWLLGFFFTDDRRLFFPYTIQFSVQVLAIWSLRSGRLGMLAASGMVVLFSVIRLVQGATFIVLLVELIVAGVALWIAAEYFRRGAAGVGRRLVAAGIGSLLAFCGLIF